MLKGENLYISSKGLSRAFNLNISYDDSTNTVIIQTLPYLTTYYEGAIANASLEKSNFSDQVKFNNEKAILNNLIVVQDEGTTLYGVNLISSNGTINSVITPRYTQVEYMEGTEDFIVTTEDKKVGIIGSDGITKVRPDYDKIEIIDKNAGLYLVTSSNKQGVINSNGKIIIHQDYDTIGLNANSYNDANVTNRYLLFGNAIPVSLNEKWGLIDKNGETIVPVEYDGIGCRDVPNTGNRNTSSVVVIPDIKGIVVEVDNANQNNNTVTRKYGIVSNLGEPMINIVLDNVYSTTIADVTTYYVTFQNQALDIVNWWYEEQSKQNNENESQNNDNIQENNDDIQNSNDSNEESDDIVQNSQIQQNDDIVQDVPIQQDDDIIQDEQIQQDDDIIQDEQIQQDDNIEE